MTGDPSTFELWRCFCGRLWASIPRAGCPCGRKTAQGFRRVPAPQMRYHFPECLSVQDRSLLRQLRISTE